MNSNKVCIDASLALTWLLATQQDASADALWRHWHEKGIEMICPAMFHAEVTSSIRKQVYFNLINNEEGEEAFSIYAGIPIKSLDSSEIYLRAWELAKELNLPRTYDMQYLAVAELNDCELWTADKRLANSVQRKYKRVRWVGEFRSTKS